MRTLEFNVPLGLMVEFAHFLLSEELDNRIIGDSEEGHIIVEVSYEAHERAMILELSERVEDYIEDNS